MPEIKNSHEIVVFDYTDGTSGAWCKRTDQFGNTYGHHSRTRWTPQSKHPTPLQYTEILEMGNYIPMVSKLLEQLMLLYNMNKGDYHDSET